MCGIVGRSHRYQGSLTSVAYASIVKCFVGLKFGGVHTWNVNQGVRVSSLLFTGSVFAMHNVCKHGKN